MLLCKISKQQTQLILAKVQKKFVVKFNPTLWKSLWTRWASPSERAPYNLMARLPKYTMPLERLRENARKNIGESTKFFEASDDNRLELYNIWRRMMR